MSLESCIESAKQFICPMTLMLDNPKKCIANECVKWCYYKEIPDYDSHSRSAKNPDPQ